MKHFSKRTFFVVLVTLLALWVIFASQREEKYSILIFTVFAWLVLYAAWVFFLSFFPKSMKAQERFDETHKGRNVFVGGRWAYDLGKVINETYERETDVAELTTEFGELKDVIKESQLRFALIYITLFAMLLIFLSSMISNTVPYEIGMPGLIASAICVAAMGFILVKVGRGEIALFDKAIIIFKRKHVVLSVISLDNIASIEWRNTATKAADIASHTFSGGWRCKIKIINGSEILLDSKKYVQLHKALTKYQEEKGLLSKMDPAHTDYKSE